MERNDVTFGIDGVHVYICCILLYILVFMSGMCKEFTSEAGQILDHCCSDLAGSYNPYSHIMEFFSDKAVQGIVVDVDPV